MIADGDSDRDVDGDSDRCADPADRDIGDAGAAFVCSQGGPGMQNCWKQAGGKLGAGVLRKSSAGSTSARGIHRRSASSCAARMKL